MLFENTREAPQFYKRSVSVRLPVLIIQSGLHNVPNSRNWPVTAVTMLWFIAFRQHKGDLSHKVRCAPVEHYHYQQPCREVKER